MTPDSREEKNALAFLDHLAGTAGYKLRAPGYLTLQNIQLLGLAIGQGEEARATLDADALRDEVNAYLFIQAALLPTVSRAVRAYRAALRQHAGARPVPWETFLCEHVEPFLAELVPADQAALAEQLGTLDEIAAARVNADPPPGQKKDRPDPNS